MTEGISERGEALLAQISFALLLDWNPLAIETEAEGRASYDRIAAQLIEMIGAGANPPELAAYLSAVESRDFGRPPRQEAAELTARTVHHLVAWEPCLPIPSDFVHLAHCLHQDFVALRRG